METAPKKTRKGQPESISTLFGTITLSNRYAEENGNLLIEGEGMILHVFKQLSTFPVLRIHLQHHGHDKYTLFFPNMLGNGALSPWCRIYDSIKQSTDL